MSPQLPLIATSLYFLGKNEKQKELELGTEYLKLDLILAGSSIGSKLFGPD